MKYLMSIFLLLGLTACGTRPVCDEPDIKDTVLVSNYNHHKNRYDVYLDRINLKVFGLYSFISEVEISSDEDYFLNLRANSYRFPDQFDCHLSRTKLKEKYNSLFVSLGGSTKVCTILDCTYCVWARRGCQCITDDEPNAYEEDFIANGRLVH